MTLEGEEEGERRTYVFKAIVTTPQQKERIKEIELRMLPLTGQCCSIITNEFLDQIGNQTQNQ